MDKKSFLTIIIVIVITFVFTMMIKYMRPASAGDVSFDDFPLTVGEWNGYKEEVSETTMKLLNPQAIISVTYTNPDGISIHLLFDFFSSDATFGGPHSPRNCLPGSGWKIENVLEYEIARGSKMIPAGRFELKFKESEKVMDFWYVTHFGETSNDYQFKLYELLSALTFKPRDVAFVRFVTDNNEVSLKALKDFQKEILPVIYNHLPYDK